MSVKCDWFHLWHINSYFITGQITFWAYMHYISVAVTSLAAHNESNRNLSKRPYNFCSTIILSVPILIHLRLLVCDYSKEGRLSLFVCTPLQMKWSRSFSHEDNDFTILMHCIRGLAWRITVCLLCWIQNSPCYHPFKVFLREIVNLWWQFIGYSGRGDGKPSWMQHCLPTRWQT